MPWETIILIARWVVVFGILGLIVLWLRGDPTVEERPLKRRWTTKEIEEFKALKRMNRRR